MTVLLTGGAGYIGSHVAVELLQSGYDEPYLSARRTDISCDDAHRLQAPQTAAGEANGSGPQAG